MADIDPRKLRRTLKTFQAHRNTLYSEDWRFVTQDLFSLIQRDAIKAMYDVPDILPVFAIEQQGGLYSVVLLKAWLNAAIGILEAELESSEDIGPVKTRDFTFIRDERLRKILERDHIEIQKALVSESYKSAIILSGSAIEAVLTDAVLQHKEEAAALPFAPKGSSDTWELGDLIKVAVALKLIGDGAEKLSTSVRQYRNLVHPGNEIRKNLHVGKEEANIAFQVLELVYRDLATTHK